jgi:hypothetical protein
LDIIRITAPKGRSFGESPISPLNRTSKVRF